MGDYYYCYCHTCRLRVALGKGIYRFDPHNGVLEEDEIQRLTRALAGDCDAEQSVGVSHHGALAFDLARLAAFVFEHGRHVLELLPSRNMDEDMLHGREVACSRWDDPLAHRREGVPRLMPVLPVTVEQQVALEAASQCECPPDDDLPWHASTCPESAAELVPPSPLREGTDHHCAAEDALNEIATMCGCSHWEYPGQVVRDVRKALDDLLHECNPCQSCGADPRVSPPSGKELPVVRGALDAQAEAEQRAIAAEQALAAMTPPIPMRLRCPICHTLHIDEGEYATKVHHTHTCQTCGETWRPAVVPTVGVRFLPGFKNEDPAP